ncbi:MAG: lipid-A-disaccharide synthase [Wenzhouxiangellaceae bacterium]
MPSARPLLVMAVGEASGDQLGAGLITALRQQRPELQIAGIGGPAMAAAGMDCWFTVDQLSVMGLAEVLRHLPRLLRLRRHFYQRIIQAQPAAFVGIDAPDFNLPLAARLQAAGITTMHYVSPSVWAWRPHRVKRIAASVQRLLCLFPFEPALYQGTGLDCVVTGHPGADAIPLSDPRASERQRLQLNPEAPILALLPGSRGSERQRLAGHFFDAARLLAKHQADLICVTAQPDERGRGALRELHQQLAPDLPLRLLQRSSEALAVCDLALCASGTVTLEALLYHRPQVAAYRLNELTYRWVKTWRLMRSPWVTLPNVLAGRMLIPEVLQHDVTGSRLATELQGWLSDEQRCQDYQQTALDIHQSLQLNAHQRAADAVMELL